MKEESLPNKIEAMLEWPEPMNVRELRQSLEEWDFPKFPDPLIPSRFVQKPGELPPQILIESSGVKLKMRTGATSSSAKQSDLSFLCLSERENL